MYVSLCRYQSRNPFDEVRTCYRTFKLYDPIDAAPAEVARHYAWRAAGQLDYIIREGLFDSEPNEILAVLDGAAAEIKRARDFVAGDDIDEFPYAVHTDSPAYRKMVAEKEAERREFAARKAREKANKEKASEQEEDAEKDSSDKPLRSKL